MAVIVKSTITLTDAQAAQVISAVRAMGWNYAGVAAAREQAMLPARTITFAAWESFACACVAALDEHHAAWELLNRVDGFVRKGSFVPAR